MQYLGNRPTRFQLGDLVEAALDTAESASQYGPQRDYAAGDVVQGIVMVAVNRDVQMLDNGRVQIRTAEGDRLWVSATEVITTAGLLRHPLAQEIVPVQMFAWVCQCGEKGFETSAEEAAHAHRRHGERAH